MSRRSFLSLLATAGAGLLVSALGARRAGYQFFGAVKIDGKSDVMTVSLHNLQGERIYTVELPPEV